MPRSQPAKLPRSGSKSRTRRTAVSQVTERLWQEYEAFAGLRASGELDAITTEWMSGSVNAPEIPLD